MGTNIISSAFLLSSNTHTLADFLYTGRTKSGMEKPIGFSICLAIILLLTSLISSNTITRSSFAQEVTPEQDSDGDSIPDDKDACPNNSNWISPCIGQEALDAQNQGSNNQDQASTMECIVSSGTCTAADILLNDNNEIICDPRQSDCSAYLTSTGAPAETIEPAPAPAVPSQPQGDQNAAKPQTYCNPSTNVCNPTDVLVDGSGNVLCDPNILVYDCSQILKTQPAAQDKVNCNPLQQICSPTDVIVDDAGNVLCDPISADCSSYYVSTPEPLDKYRDITGGDPNAQVLQATILPAQYCNPRSESCMPDYTQIPGMQPYGCFIIITTDEKVCDNTSKAKPNVYHSFWTHYPVVDQQGLEEAQAQENEQDEIDRITCESVEKTGEIVGVAYSCIKAGGEVAITDPKAFGELEQLAIHQSGKELAFCGSGVIFHEDPAGLLLGKVGSLSCKGTRGIVERIQGTDHIVARFMAADYDRIEKERPAWCEKYGVTPDEFGHCWGLENDYDSCAKAQAFWIDAQPETYGVGKPMKFRDGSVLPIQRGQFEYPCAYPPIPPEENQVCTPESNVCTFDPLAP